jgi:hypothetical protein
MQSNEESFLKKARNKYLSTKFVLFLINGNQGSPLIKSYWSSHHCSHELVVNEHGNLVGKYCKCRWCLTCNKIRTAILILGYGPQLRELDDLHFVTLTAVTCSRSDLPERIRQFEKIWGTILAQNRKDCQRGRGRVLIGLRKCECTARPGDLYHYHFHILVEGKENGEWLLEQWRKRVAAAGLKISSSAQDIRKADEGSFIELFKYSTKISTKQRGKDDYLATPQQLDWIFQCLRGKRTFQPFGGLHKVEEEFEDDSLVGQPLPDTLEGRVWEWLNSDWVSEYGELLTGYEPSEADLKSFKYESEQVTILTTKNL